MIRFPVNIKMSVLAICVLGLAECLVAKPDTTSGSMMMHEKMRGGGVHEQYQKAMMSMNHGMMSAPMSGDPDKDFASMMIPHHQGAIDMAKIELEHGKDPMLRKLAEGVVETQEKEIREMKERLVTLGKDVPSTSSNHSKRD